ncbi:MAG: hypothetical protein EHM54_05440 [Nitrospiraceae bacterium]|nr:MAG: hypothetical protein EHM54_05440 [Nitrospiraceae bacterium]
MASVNRNNMNKTTAFRIFLIVSIVCFIPYAAHSETISENNTKIRRLSPSAFSELPQSIRRSLESRRCKIPQVHNETAPHNIIRGEFIKKGQKDLAVLCSREHISTILIFQGGSASKVLEIASSPDEAWLQNFTDGQYGFSREIIVAAKKQIKNYHSYAKEFGDAPDLPPITHDGIDDAFVGKGSAVHYFYKGKWLQLSGAD